MSTRTRAVISSLFGLILCALSAVSAGAAPSAVTTLVATTNCQIQLQWNAPDNGGGGPCGSYLVKYSTTAAIRDAAAFEKGTTYYQTWTPLTPGATETKLLSGLAPRTTYWFSIRSSSDTAWSALSSTDTCMSSAGTFADNAAGLVGVFNSALSWGDYDNDGDLDLAITGSSGTYISRIYRNDAGTFGSGPTLPVGVYYGSVSWGDYDNDGDLDLALSGYGTTYITRIYRNDGSSFVDNNAGLPGTYRGSLAWGDYDNDGDLDLAYSGYNTTYITRLYRNDTNRFTYGYTGMTGVYYSSLSWGDCDNDGDLDLALAGYYTTYLNRVYRNTTASGTTAFTGVNITPALRDCSVTWGDYDNDGDLDLAMAGYSGAYQCRVFKNAGGSLTDSGAVMTGVQYAALSWGDCDSDGDLDLALAGNTGSANISRIYRNDSTSLADSGIILPGVQYGSLSFGDYDNDGDLDLALAGQTEAAVNISRIYASLEADFGNSNKDARAPSAPATGFDALYSYANKKLSLQWDKAMDNDIGATATDGLYYEIRMATETISDGLRKWIVSPSTGLGVGSASSQNIGSYPHGYSVAASTQPGAVITTTGTLAGYTYYWQVRTIDAGLRKSAWSTEQAYYVSAPDPTPPGGISDLTALAGGSNTAILQWTSPGDDDTNGNLLVDSKFRIKYSSVAIITAANFDSPPAAYAVKTLDISTVTGAQSTNSRAITGLTEAMYWFAIKTMDESLNWSVWNSSGDAAAVNTLAWYSDTTPPGQITGFAAAEGAQVQLTWTAPGDDEYTGNVTAGKWRIDYSSTTTTPGPDASYTLEIASSFNQGTTTYGCAITGLQPRTVYSFQMLARDDAGNWGTTWSSPSTTTADSLAVVISTNITGVRYCSLSWGDYDNDGDLDLALAGTNGTRYSRVYRNDAGSFVNATGTNITAVEKCSLSWGDYDNDGDLDLALAGDSGSSISRVYRNDSGSFVNMTGTSITGVYYCSLSWGDYDNDGDLDLALAGYGGSYISRVYRNDSGSFVNASGTSINGMDNCSLSWGDFDNDGDLDLALAGGMVTYSDIGSRVYRNDGGSFVNATGTSITAVDLCSLSWGDYDNDGDLDLALAGSYASSSCISRVYRNDGGSFVNATGTTITGVDNSSLGWGDYDNDGDLDLAMAGTYGSYISRVYRNDAGSFVNATGAGVTGVYACSMGWGDFDNDGDIDLALSGQSSSGPISRIYTSLEAEYGNSNKGSRAPAVPSELSMSFDAMTELLSIRWNKASDNSAGATPDLGVYYEIRMATEPVTDDLKHWIISPSTGAGVGAGANQRLGSYPHGFCDPSLMQAGFDLHMPMQNTTYYWQVRSMDAGLCKSAWSVQESTFVPADATPPGQVTGCSASTGMQMILTWTAPGDNGYIANVTGGMWRIDYSTATDQPGDSSEAQSLIIETDYIQGRTYSKLITGLMARATYYFQIKARDGAGYWSTEWSNIASGVAGSFFDMQVGLPGVFNSRLSWGDYDNDGDLDLALAGWAGTQITKIYRNDTVGFVDINAPLINVDWVAFSWGDYDNDGDLDLAYAGTRSPNYTLIYRNDGGSFVENGAGLPGVDYTAIAWGDYDNDGDLDLVFSGRPVSHGTVDVMTRLYRNDALRFNNAGAALTNVSFSALSWGDYDNDGDLDLASSGAPDGNGNTFLTRIYRNDNSSFVTATDLTGVYFGSFGWGDYDSDGDLDLAMCGFAGNGSYISRVYRNNAKNLVVGTSLTGVERGTIGWGDYDNDGDLDLALTGTTGSSYISRIYRNDITGFANTNPGFPGAYHSSMIWGDYDNDGDLDLVLSGDTGNGAMCSIYRSFEAEYGNANIGTRAPSAPASGFASWYSYSGNSLSLQWDKATDNGQGATPSKGLYYEIRMATESVSDSTPKWVISPSTGLGVGSGSGQTLGSYPHGYCTAASLQPGLTIKSTSTMVGTTYYWQVRAMDAGLCKSEWSPVHSKYIQVQELSPPAGISNLTALAGAEGGVTLAWTAPGSDGTSGDLLFGSKYRIKYSTVAMLTAADFDVPPAGYAVKTVDVSTVTTALSSQSLTINDLVSGTTVWFAIKTMDEAENWSMWNASADDPTINTQAWLNYTDTSSPGQVIDVSAVNRSTIADGAAVLLSWTSPGDDGYSGNTVGGTWRIDYSSAAETPGEDGGSGVSSVFISTSFAQGEQYAWFITGLVLQTTYYFQLKARDEAGNWSSLCSSAVRVTTIMDFADSNARLLGMHYAALSWGDYDNDGDLDLALAGYGGYSYNSFIYRNDSGSFVKATGPPITGVHQCSLSWGDYDNDGDLDLALAGNASNQNVSRVYRNDAGSFVNATGTTITGVYQCSLSWGDYDNDGDLDLALAGCSDTSGYIYFSGVYNNNAGNFVNATGITITGVYQCSLSWGDYDNDGDLDLALAGMNGPYISRVYRNDAGSFLNATGTDITGVYNCSLSWGDYDNDGDLDLALAGYNGSFSPYCLSRVYRNDAGIFVNATGTSITEVYQCSLSWGDYDNDGDLDLALAGVDAWGTHYISRVYGNDAGSFVDRDAALPGVCSGALSWGDCDNDGDLDLALAGYTGSNSITKVFTSFQAQRDNSNLNSRSPSAPSTGFNSAYSTTTHSLSLRWDRASDNGVGATAVNGLYYEIRVATEPISDDVAAWVVSPSKGAGVGSGPAQRLGSYPHGYCDAATTQPGCNLLPPFSNTTYYWQVRTLDAGLQKSAWSVQQSTYVPTDVWAPGQVRGVTAASGLQILLTWTAPGDNEYTGNVTNGMWRIDYSSVTETPGDTGGSGVYSIYSPADFPQGTQYSRTLTGLVPRVTYYFQLKARDGAGYWGAVWSSSASAVAGVSFDTKATLPGVDYSFLSWGDYDNDGDLDLAVCGTGDAESISRVYRNDAGSFVNATGASITGISDGSLSWGDYDNDGDLDLALAGSSISRVYRNDAGSFVNGTGSSVVGVFMRSAISWGDYDNDGDLDFALAGYSNSSPYLACVYKNDSGSFANDTGVSLSGGFWGSMSWGDYDNDGDLDLALMGVNNYTCVYRNTAGSFVNATGTSLTYVYYGSVSWGDYDNDGDLDLALCGSGSGILSRVYRNNAGSFVDVTGASLTGMDKGGMSWGDYDNDGDLDLALCGSGLSHVYSNNAGSFVNAPGDIFTGVMYGSLSWGDYDADGDLDLALAGSTATNERVSKIYVSNDAAYGNSNSGVRSPSAPTTGFSTTYSTTTCKLSLLWDKATDNGAGATPADGLYYEIRMATEPVNDNVRSWIISPSTGQGVGSGPSQRLGSYPHGYCSAGGTQPGLIIANPPNGTTYYWQVRTLDTGLAKSGWSLEHSAYVPADEVPPGKVTGLTAVCGLHVLLSWTAPGDDGYAGAVTGGQWRIDYSSSTETPGETGGSSVHSLYIPVNTFIPGQLCTAPMTGLAPRVTYYFQIKARDEAQLWSPVWSSSASAVINVSYGAEISLTGVDYCSLSWGDYDNDGDLDLAVAGNTGSSYLSRIYRNDAGSFVDRESALPGTYGAALSWGDYDNDGDLDLAVCGYNNTCVYGNDAGSFVNVTRTSITGVYYGAMSWGDYDNDGDLDLALAGSGAGYLTRVYRNDAGNFVNATGDTFTAVSQCSLSWGDYDNDGDLDLALAGANGTGVSRVYRNTAGSFANATADSITGVYNCSLSWGDYDNDGDLDLALAGYGASLVSCVYRNDAGSFFNATGANITGVQYCSLSWGDYDNDGDLDLALAGTYSYPNSTSRVYRNDAASFVDATGAGITGVYNCCLSWGDIDADGDLDLALAGSTATNERISKIYVSNDAEYGNSNSGVRSPSAPTTGFNATYSSTTCKLSLLWDKATDNGAGATPADGLYYEIRMATEPVNDSVRSWIISPSTGQGVGSGSNQRLGSYPHGYCSAGGTQPGVSIANPPNGATYYWQVRTLDAGLAKSAWSVEQTAYVSADDVSPGKVTGLTAVNGMQMLLSWTAPGDDGYAGALNGGLWRIDYSSVENTPGDTGGSRVSSLYQPAYGVPGSRCSLSITGLVPKTTYYFQIKARDESGNWSAAWSSPASGVAEAGFILGTELEGAAWSALSWGDYDNDGDLDLAINGESNRRSADVSLIYRNETGTFVDIGAGLIGTEEGGVCWGDYDNDGDLDLAVCGWRNDYGPASIYRNDGGSFVNTNIVMPMGDCGSVRWGDYDNDGDVDIALTGDYRNGSGNWNNFTHIYRNDAAGFVDINSVLPEVDDSAVCWGDYDNDGDLDLAVSGYVTSGNNVTCIYRNDAGVFADINAGMTGVESSALSWGDYDNDGDLDLAVAGDYYDSSYINISRIYRNDAGSFADINSGLMGVEGGCLSWGDNDNDGDLDLALCGWGDAGEVASIYRNDAGSFVDLKLGLPGLDWWSSINWGDYDSDGDLDLALTGESESGYITHIYQSISADMGDINTAPVPPNGMAASFAYAAARSTLTFTWAPGQYDAGHSQHSLYYQIVVATNPTTWDGTKFAGTSHFTIPWQNGTPLMGTYVRPAAKAWPGESSARHAQFFTGDTALLQPETTYYWRVQTIDAGLRRSEWSAEYAICTSVNDTTPPAAISNLTALPGKDTAVRLTWTSPGDDATGGTLENGLFRIKYSSVAIITAADYDAPSPDYAVQTIDISTRASPGTHQIVTLTQLTVGTTYWFAIRAMDNAGHWSVWNSSADVATVNTLAWGVVKYSNPAAVTNLAAVPGADEGAIDLTWTSPFENYDGTGGRVSRYIIKHATFSAVSLSGGATAWWVHHGLTAVNTSSTTIHAPGATESFNVSALTPGVTYYFGIVSEDDVANVSDIDVRAYTAQATAAARDLPPDTPTGLAVVSISTYAASLSWDIMSAATGYMDFSYYELYRSTPGAVMVLVSTTTFTVYVDITVTAESTYYYQLRAVDREPSRLMSSTSPVVMACTPAIPFNGAVPRPPSGIKLESTRAVKTILWSPVQYNVDGTPSTNLRWYAVYRSNNPRSGWELIGTTDACVWNDMAPITGTWYYKVRTVTTNSVESVDSLLCDTSFNILALSNDSRVMLTIPHTLSSPLYPGALCGEDVNIECIPLGDQTSLASIDAYEFTARNAQTDEKIRSFRFAQARAKLTYFWDDTAARAAIDSETAKDLAFYWFNGVEWIKVGTEKAGATVVTFTSRLGKYAVKESPAATTFTLNTVYPKTFSPNGDGRNDHVEFQYENPCDASVVGKIFDKTGAQVAELREGIMMDTLMWDGKTSKGTVAWPGAYVYQIEVTGSETKVINGIVVVAR